MYLVTKWFGTFLCDKKGVKKEILFPKNEKEIVKRLRRMEKNNILSEERKIAKDVIVIVNEKRLQKIGEYTDFDPYFKEINIEPKDYGFSQDLFHKISLTLAQKKVEERLTRAEVKLSIFIDKKLGELELAAKIGVDVIAIRRRKEWIVNPSEDETILEGDILIARGAPLGVDELKGLAEGKIREMG